MIHMVREHIAGLARHPCTRDARVVFIPERNLGEYAQDVADAVVRLPNCTVMGPANEFVYGVYTLPNMRVLYARHLRAHLRKRSLTLHAHDAAHPLVCECTLHGANETRATRTRRTLAQFALQLRGFQSLTFAPRLPTSRAVVVAAGNVDREQQVSKRFRHDMVMALLVGIFYSLHLEEDTKVFREIGPHNRLTVHHRHNNPVLLEPRAAPPRMPPLPTNNKRGNDAAAAEQTSNKRAKH